MTNYETLFILDPALEDEKRQETIETVKGIIATDGEVADVDDWGLKKLAYPIRKKNEGHYVVITFKAGEELPKELDRRMRISDAVMRHIIINREEELKHVQPGTEPKRYRPAAEEKVEPEVKAAEEAKPEAVEEPVPAEAEEVKAEAVEEAVPAEAEEAAEKTEEATQEEPAAEETEAEA